MAAKSYPERDRDIFNWWSEMKQAHLENSYIYTRINEKLGEKYHIELSESSIMRIVKHEKLLVEIEQLNAEKTTAA